MTENTCQSCNYWREPINDRDREWCSNSRSRYFGLYVVWSGSCKEYYEGGKKAPWWLLLVIKLLQLGRKHGVSDEQKI